MQQISQKFESIVATLAGNSSVQNKRRAAFSLFEKLDFPKKSNEEYKYSSTEKLALDTYSFDTNFEAQNIDITPYLIPESNAIQLVLLNGQFQNSPTGAHQLPQGCIIGGLKEIATKHPELIEKYYGTQLQEVNDAFAQLNTAFAEDGIVIYIPENVQVQEPIHIINVVNTNAAQFLNPHHLMIVEKGASVTIIESFNTIEGSQKYVLNSASEVWVQQNASANYYKLQVENNSATHINTSQVSQYNDSHFNTNTVTIGANWLRNNLNILMEGTNCETHLNGLQILGGNQHVDNHTLVDHRMPHCESNQLYKGILNNKSTGVFNGKIFVRKDAQKTNAYQSSKNMLLSDDATMNTKPQLEIYADDVKCSHGSSTGQIDENALFYLRARGLSEASANALLMNAFALDVVHTVHNEAYKSYVEALISNCFNY